MHCVLAMISYVIFTGMENRKAAMRIYFNSFGLLFFFVCSLVGSYTFSTFLINKLARSYTLRVAVSESERAFVQ